MKTDLEDCAETPRSEPAFVLQGVSSAVTRLRTQVRRMAPYYRSVLLIGEPGTGKEQIARELHRLSPLTASAFLHCPSDRLSDEMVASARTCTLFLPGLERLKLDAQDQLLEQLKHLEANIRTRSAETRLIFASECDLRGMVVAGRMREELARRAGGLELHVPALRERLEDLPALLGDVHAEEETLDRMRVYGWPGNLRELRTLLAGAAGRLTLEMLPCPEPAEEETLADVSLDGVLRRHVADVLERCAGNKLRAAERLGISRSTLYRMLDAGI